MDFRPTIGLETHVQLATKSKLFCACANRFGEPPNTLICPVCTGQPGVLPVLNEEALRLGIRAALALDATVANDTKFDRKHYFYPDLPKGYQISQYDLPFSSGGGIALHGIAENRGGFVRLRRIHLEEDAGKAIHDRGDDSLVDLNRAGVPLLEIVTEPDVHSAEQAHDYLTSLKEILRFTGVSECDMEKGSLRCDVNVSIAPAGAKEFGTRVEVKNLNSFAMVKKAIQHEIARQTKVLESGGRISQETRTWRDGEGRTEVLRSKEEAHDYRYFPEPDLPRLTITPATIDAIRADVKELPEARRARYKTSYGLNAEEIGTLTIERDAGPYFEELAAASGDPKAAAIWVCGEVNRVRNEKGLTYTNFPIRPPALAGLLALVKGGKASVGAARQVFDAMAANPNKSAAALLAELGLEQVSDPAAIEAACREALDANAKAVAEYRAGKEKALGAVVGQVMKKTGGRANPAMVQETLRRLLGSP
jgi:aspartyl-tRNA(Asn)/glutamyl-tRNA(Gln) amidotransferase subunit B